MYTVKVWSISLAFSKVVWWRVTWRQCLPFKLSTYQYFYWNQFFCNDLRFRSNLSLVHKFSVIKQIMINSTINFTGSQQPANITPFFCQIRLASLSNQHRKTNKKWWSPLLIIEVHIMWGTKTISQDSKPLENYKSAHKRPQAHAARAILILCSHIIDIKLTFTCISHFHAIHQVVGSIYYYIKQIWRLFQPFTNKKVRFRDNELVITVAEYKCGRKKPHCNISINADLVCNIWGFIPFILWITRPLCKKMKLSRKIYHTLLN